MEGQGQTLYGKMKQAAASKKALAEAGTRVRGALDADRGAREAEQRDTDEKQEEERKTGDTRDEHSTEESEDDGLCMRISKKAVAKRKARAARQMEDSDDDGDREEGLDPERDGQKGAEEDGQRTASVTTTTTKLYIYQPGGLGGARGTRPKGGALHEYPP